MRVGVDIGDRQVLKLCERLAADIAHDTIGDSVVDDVHEPLKEGCRRGRDGDFDKQGGDIVKIHLSGLKNEVDGVADENRHV